MPAAKKNTSTKKSAEARKPASKKSAVAAKKMTPKKTAAKSATEGTGRKYSPAASESVGREMDAMKKGKLKSGSGQKVTNPKQAIAIGLSEARKAGKKVPPLPKR